VPFKKYEACVKIFTFLIFLMDYNVKWHYKTIWNLLATFIKLSVFKLPQKGKIHFFDKLSSKKKLFYRFIYLMVRFNLLIAKNKVLLNCKVTNPNTQIVWSYFWSFYMCTLACYFGWYILCVCSSCAVLIAFIYTFYTVLPIFVYIKIIQ